ncbi:D-2-hydroxyglutarate dehydrogenase YdiJ [Aliidiomarina sp. Khilg15.8]
MQPESSLEEVYQAFLQALRASDFSGDIDASYGGRLIAATDNSIYQQLPQAVIYPRTQDDVALIMQMAAQDEHQGVRFSPRGGGTGTNGQSLTAWLVLDLSRHLTRILEINAEEGWARVESGLIKDELNQALAPFGYFFAPDTSTSNRATIGGMINTDASGQGSLVYGKTSDHVLAMRSYTMQGQCLDTSPIPLAEARVRAAGSADDAVIYQQVLDSCVEKRNAIEAKFPPLNRFLTGYDLKHAYDPEQQTIDVGRLITGSEGTLAIVTEARVKITPIPQHKVLVNVKYSDFQAALRHAPELVHANATSVETIDSKVLNLARQDIVWHGVKDMLQETPDEAMDGINMVEFTGLDQSEIDAKVTNLEKLLQRALSEPGNGVIGYQICADADSIGRIYAMRKKAVGLLGATKGRNKPIAFVEDTAVPPEQLADYIHEFRQLLDSYDLDYGMFGHVDAGVLHVRPALDMQNAAHEKLVREVSDKVMALTARYGGLMWGEHGKGYRSEYGPEFFGFELFTELRKVKAAFDPLNRLNPGKICTPIDSDDLLVSVDARKRGWFDRQIPTQVQAEFQPAMDCNGNGLCFSFDATTPMCPSYRVTGDRRHSPKGRAALIREWLRQNSAHGFDVTQAASSDNWFGRYLRTRFGGKDFNHEVKASMDECLACKACSSQCPVKVDIPTHRARFFAHYYGRYARPLRDYAVKNIERMLPFMARAPRLTNLIINNPLSSRLAASWLGYQDMPALSVPALNKRPVIKKTQGWKSFLKQQQGKALTDAEASQYIALVQDPFTSFYEAELVEDFIELCSKLNIRVIRLPYRANGKAAHVKGFLNNFAEVAGKQAQLLNQAASYNLPLVGLDTSTVLCYRDEYAQALGAHRGSFHVQMLHEWLLPQMEKQSKSVAADSSAELFSHCTEQTADAGSAEAWQRIFEQAGVHLTAVKTGCCGMAGTYGHEAEHQAQSRALFDMSWAKPIAKSQRPLATGFSCRCQSVRFSERTLQHPLQYLLTALN